jgi:hypothetical protein
MDGIVHRDAPRAGLVRRSVGRALACLLLVLTGLMACGCYGPEYNQGFVRHRVVDLGLFEFDRDATKTEYSILTPHFLSAGATWHGNQFVNVFDGLLLTVNIPGSTWLLYPFQFSDTGPDAQVFGAGSGNGDLRLSLLYGMISLGLEWNIFWVNGFWFWKNDPLFNKEPSKATKEYFEGITLKE